MRTIFVLVETMLLVAMTCCVYWGAFSELIGRRSEYAKIAFMIVVVLFLAVLFLNAVYDPRDT